MAVTSKKQKYVDLSARYFFEPIAGETLGVFNASALMTWDGGSLFIMGFV